MAKTFTAPFAQTPKNATGVATLASVIGTAGAPTNTVNIGTAGGDGALVTRVRAIPIATNTATSMYLFISNDRGLTKHLVESAVLPAGTVSATAAAAPTFFANISEYTPLRLEANTMLFCSIGSANAAGIVFTAEISDY